MTNDLNKNLGFYKNPFSKFSAEEEYDFSNEIFYEPTFYNTLLDDLKSGTSRFILGQRGHGKSSIIHKLKYDLDKSKIMTVIIDRFDDISISDNKIELLNLILEKLVEKFVLFLDRNRVYLYGFSKEDKEILALMIKLFFKPLTKTEYINKYDSVKNVKRKNWFIRLYNKLLRPANTIINSGVTITSKIISDSFGLNNYEDQVIYRKYLPEIDEINLDANKEEINLKYNKKRLKDLLNRLNDLIKKTYYNSTVVLFDKVDEFQELEQDINKIATFTEDILTDTELLLQNDIAIAFSLWTEVKPILSRKVRFDKFKELDISWKRKDMEPLIDKRVQHFSGNTKVFENLFSSKSDMNQVIDIANKSPRDLISCMSDIYDYQTNNQEVEHFESENVSKGLIKFAKRYNYLSLYPSRTARNKDLLTIIGKILRLRKTQFDVNDFNKEFNLKTRISLKSIDLMLKYKLITEDAKLGCKGEKIYLVTDPKLIHLIKRNEISLDL